MTITATTPTLVFADCKTTGTDRARHDMYEGGFIVRKHGPASDAEYGWWFPVNLRKADAAALQVGRYYQRSKHATEVDGWQHKSDSYEFARPGHEKLDWKAWHPVEETAAILARLLSGAVIVSARIGRDGRPGFDAGMVDKFLRSHDQALACDYHLIEIESYAAGALGASPPWKLSTLAEELQVPLQPDGHAHTALGDARLVRDVYDAAQARHRAMSRLAEIAELVRHGHMGDRETLVAAVDEQIALI